MDSLVPHFSFVITDNMIRSLLEILKMIRYSFNQYLIQIIEVSANKGGVNIGTVDTGKSEGVGRPVAPQLLHDVYAGR